MILASLRKSTSWQNCIEKTARVQAEMSGYTWKAKMPGFASIRKGLAWDRTGRAECLKTNDLAGIILRGKEEKFLMPTLMMHGLAGEAVHFLATGFSTR